jgi:hypothetical protein
MWRDQRKTHHSIDDMPKHAAYQIDDMPSQNIKTNTKPLMLANAKIPVKVNDLTDHKAKMPLDHKMKDLTDNNMKVPIGHKIKEPIKSSDILDISDSKTSKSKNSVSSLGDF